MSSITFIVFSIKVPSKIRIFDQKAALVNQPVRAENFQPLLHFIVVGIFHQ
jgi:hypothetical protein